MANNSSLGNAKQAKKDEFYTQYEDIQKEINAYLEFDKNTFRGKTVLLPCDDPEWSNFTRYFAGHFEELGLKKLISTSYAVNSKKDVYKVGEYYTTLFEMNSPQYDEDITMSRGKIFTLTGDKNNSGKVDVDDLEWQYLDGDGDFRSAEVRALRDEADIIVTNPPFSLFREFLAWILEADKKFLIIGNQNAITYKEVFPLIKANKLWMGESIHSGDRKFYVPDNYPLDAATCGEENGRKFIRVKGVRWFTNLDHGRRHKPLELMTMADNLRYNNHGGKLAYPKYDNYDAIEVSYTDAIPSDYTGVMGVPITFLDKYCPEQFEIVGIAKRGAGDPALKSRVYTKEDYNNYSDLNAGPVIIQNNGIPKNTYPRILIKQR